MSAEIPVNSSFTHLHAIIIKLLKLPLRWAIICLGMHTGMLSVERGNVPFEEVSHTHTHKHILFLKAGWRVSK